MTPNEELLIEAFMRHCFSCPLDDNAEIDFERECVGYREPGCKECILKHIENLRLESERYGGLQGVTN